MVRLCYNKDTKGEDKSHSKRKELKVMKKHGVIEYKYNMQFQYRYRDEEVLWYTEQNKYIGATTENFFEICKLLDEYIENR